MNRKTTLSVIQVLTLDGAPRCFARHLTSAAPSSVVMSEKGSMSSCPEHEATDTVLWKLLEYTSKAEAAPCHPGPSSHRLLSASEPTPTHYHYHLLALMVPAVPPSLQRRSLTASLSVRCRRRSAGRPARMCRQSRQWMGHDRGQS